MKLPGDAAKLGITDSHEFLGFVKLCFAQKRKTLVNNLRELAEPETIKAALAALNLATSARAEALSVAELAALFETVRKRELGY